MLTEKKREGGSRRTSVEALMVAIGSQNEKAWREKKSIYPRPRKGYGGGEGRGTLKRRKEPHCVSWLKPSPRRVASRRGTEKMRGRGRARR